MRNKKIMLLLLLIILLGIALRFSALDREAYWLDEGFAMLTGEQESLSAVTDSVLFYETAPPLYFYILKIWIDLFGNSEFSTRFLSALFSLLSIVFIFLASRRISDDFSDCIINLLPNSDISERKENNLVSSLLFFFDSFGLHFLFLSFCHLLSIYGSFVCKTI